MATDINRLHDKYIDAVTLIRDTDYIRDLKKWVESHYLTKFKDKVIALEEALTIQIRDIDFECETEIISEVDHLKALYQPNSADDNSIDPAAIVDFQQLVDKVRDTCIQYAKHVWFAIAKMRQHTTYLVNNTANVRIPIANSSKLFHEELTRSQLAFSSAEIQLFQGKWNEDFGHKTLNTDKTVYISKEERQEIRNGQKGLLGKLKGH